ncbi:hypothetical protein HPP92_003350 [Vanilla planifolia]|uniref:HMA domain-containing protein n=1 Tax=Vanilla planifolia TaxID=51239 RepID=A0A835S622_VANPL|nr:hypothetical protein HPP92_003350 [Vanilla planifolia]
MNKEEDFKLLKIQTIVLKVNIHCDGCKHEVKRLLHRIEGVYAVNIDVENQKVTVSGNVDSSSLIKRLARSGKHAELCSQKPNNQNRKLNQQKVSNPVSSKQQGKQEHTRDTKALKNHHKLQFFCSDDEHDEEDEKELRFMEKTKQASSTATVASAKNGNGGKKNAEAKPKVGNPAVHLLGGNRGGGDGKGSTLMNHNNGVMGMGHMMDDMQGFQLPYLAMNGRGPCNNNAMMMNQGNGYLMPQMMCYRSPQIIPYMGYYPQPSSSFFLTMASFREVIMVFISSVTRTPTVVCSCEDDWVFHYMFLLLLLLLLFSNVLIL